MRSCAFILMILAGCAVEVLPGDVVPSEQELKQNGCSMWPGSSPAPRLTDPTQTLAAKVGATIAAGGNYAPGMNVRKLYNGQAAIDITTSPTPTRAMWTLREIQRWPALGQPCTPQPNGTWKAVEQWGVGECRYNNDVAEFNCFQALADNQNSTLPSGWVLGYEVTFAVLCNAQGQSVHRMPGEAVLAADRWDEVNNKAKVGQFYKTYLDEATTPQNPNTPPLWGGICPCLNNDCVNN